MAMSRIIGPVPSGHLLVASSVHHVGCTKRTKEKLRMKTILSSEKETVTSAASAALASRKKATVEDIASDLSKKGFDKKSAYGALRRLTKHGFAFTREDAAYEFVSRMSPLQDTLIRRMENRGRFLAKRRGTSESSGRAKRSGSSQTASVQA